MTKRLQTLIVTTLIVVAVIGVYYRSVVLAPVTSYVGTYEITYAQVHQVLVLNKNGTFLQTITVGNKTKNNCGTWQPDPQDFGGPGITFHHFLFDDIAEGKVAGSFELNTGEMSLGRNIVGIPIININEDDGLFFHLRR